MQHIENQLQREGIRFDVKIKPSGVWYTCYTEDINKLKHIFRLTRFKHVPNGKNNIFVLRR